jgi:hypothetical protein
LLQAREGTSATRTLSFECRLDDEEERALGGRAKEERAVRLLLLGRNV